MVPFWIHPSRDHGDRLPLVQVLLPKGEVDKKAEIVPGQHAGQACADLVWIGRFDVLIWFLVNLQVLCLSLVVEESGMCFFVYVFEEDG